MAFSLVHIQNPLFRQSFPSLPFPQFLPKFPLHHLKFPHFSASNQRLSSEQAVLDAIADLDANEHTLPAVRTYENDLAGLTLVGAVAFNQALTAAAADGGEAADEHLSSGMAVMVVETIFPGPSDDNSTISTRLFLPARKVKEKAMKLKKSLKKDMWKGSTSKNILAVTFRQVVMEQLWSLELALFRPGSVRNMDNLANPREVHVIFTLSSSDERVISEIAEVVLMDILDNTGSHFLDNRASRRFFSWFSKHKQISSSDSSVVLHNFLEHEMLANARTLLEQFNLERGKYNFKETKLKNSLLSSAAFSKLEKIGGSEFCSWISECVPSYMLEIDADKLTGVKLEGWRKSDGNRWDVVLTHSQMVSLVNILDMYYDDTFTLPNKRLPGFEVGKSSKLALNKGHSLLKMLPVFFVTVICVVVLSILGKLYLPRLSVSRKYMRERSKPSSSEMSYIPCNSVDPSELEACCVSIIQRIKDSFGWPGEIRTNSGGCSWTGELPMLLRNVDDTDLNSGDISAPSLPVGASNGEIKPLEDIASYQVTMSTDCKIMGFQPTNRVGVNNWAANPLAKELYGGKELSPGLMEPGVKFNTGSGGVMVLELLMSSNPHSYFALVRTID